jgi:hypothetical protein
MKEETKRDHRTRVTVGLEYKMQAVVGFSLLESDIQ